MRKELNSQRIFLVHQHGRRFIVLEHQYGRRDVMWKRSIAAKIARQSNHEVRLEIGQTVNMFLYYQRWKITRTFKGPSFLKRGPWQQYRWMVWFSRTFWLSEYFLFNFILIWQSWQTLTIKRKRNFDNVDPADYSRTKNGININQKGEMLSCLCRSLSLYICGLGLDRSQVKPCLVMSRLIFIVL